jgi:transposase
MATRAEWTKRLKRWQSSGLDADQFARREGLEVKQLYWWRWKLGSPVSTPSGTPRLLPVRGVEPSPPPVAASTAPPAPAWIDIALPDGGLVRVLPGVDAATLASMLAVVAELSR